ncbi:GGDEF domain-containing protein [Microbulbifer hainanensis]|uniref:GGDEF domain-containing protein n=1 Tax=Microbulbifer hainanensis TaxID=2735675 RepID=UPI001865E28C|nr:GGDEF domain-containing protein [Microbulbifer hainanensis]
MPSYFFWLRYGWSPGLLLAGFAAQYFSWFDFRPLLNDQLPLVLLGGATALGTFFKSSRTAYAAALLLTTWLAMGHLDWLQPGPLKAVSLGLVALNLALVAGTRDRSPLSGFGLALGCAIAVQGVALYLLGDCCTDLLATSWHLPIHTGLPLSAAKLLFASALLLASFRAIFRPDHTAFAMLACIVVLFWLFNRGVDDWGLTLSMTGAGILLVLLVLRSAYELAFRDELTGIPSRRAYSRYLLTLGRNYSIAVIDIDHFKKLNDRHGHQVGDEALRMVAGQIARFGGGRAFRYGGEEFVVVMRGSDRERAERSLEHMREKIAGYSLRLRSPNRMAGNSPKVRRSRGQGGKGKVIKTTVSVGVAVAGDKLKTPDDVLQAADRALYKAKRSGRNRVCVQNG